MALAPEILSSVASMADKEEITQDDMGIFYRSPTEYQQRYLIQATIIAQAAFWKGLNDH
jgi:hypothetical protein